MISIYRNSLEWVLDNSALTLIVLGLTVALNVLVIMQDSQRLFPQQDTGVLVGGVQGPQDASFPFMQFSMLAGEHHQAKIQRWRT